MPLLIPVSWGELFDKITILEIKKDHISDHEKLVNINNELMQLRRIAVPVNVGRSDLSDILIELREVNQQLWQIEDDIRLCEKEKRFDNRFIELARSVYISNDKRARLKYRINQILDSDLVEEKSYEPY